MRTCTICRHNERLHIDRALIDGEAYRTVAKRFGASASAVFRHQKSHLPQKLSKSNEAVTAAKELLEERERLERDEAGTLFERLRALNRETREILTEARQSGNNVIALQAIARAEKQLEIEGRLLGEIDGAVRLAIGVRTELRIEDLSDSVLEKLARSCPGKLAADIPPGLD